MNYLEDRVKFLLKSAFPILTMLSLSPVFVFSANAQDESILEPLTWARVDFVRNRVQIIPHEEQSRGARIDDVLSLADVIKTARASRAELRFNEGSLARIGERATFRFTPNTRDFQLGNGTILLLLRPDAGRSNVQTPNSTIRIPSGSALFVRYVEAMDISIIGILSNHSDSPIVLFNKDGIEQLAMRSNEIGVIQGNQVVSHYPIDGGAEMTDEQIGLILSTIEIDYLIEPD